MAALHLGRIKIFFLILSTLAGLSQANRDKDDSSCETTKVPRLSHKCTKLGQILCDYDWNSYRKCIFVNNQLEPRTFHCKTNAIFDPYREMCVKIPGGGKIVTRKNRRRTRDIRIFPDDDNSLYYYANTPAGVMLLRCPALTKFDRKTLKCKKVTKKSKRLGDGTTGGSFRKPVIKLPECKRVGKFPITGSDRLYYTCTRGNNYGDFDRTVHACREGTVFCPITGRCVPRVNKKNIKRNDEHECGGGGEYPPCTAVGWFRVPNDCRRYYSCIRRSNSGKLYQAKFTCAEGEAFSLDKKICLPENLVPGCSSPVVLTGIELYPCVKEGRVPLPDLTGFYDCIPLSQGGFRRVFTHCNEGEVYCHGKQKCIPLIDESKKQQNTTCKSPGWFADYQNCGMYFHCVPNNCGGYDQTYYQCPKGEAFDEKSGKCTIKAMKECLYPMDTYTAGDLFVCKSPGSFATYDCTGYCTCTLNKDGSFSKICTKCADGQRYCEDLGICCDAKLSKCVPIKDRKVVFECDHTGIFPVVNNDNAYVICTKNLNGTYTATTHHCPCGTYFNPTFGFCVQNDCPAVLEIQTTTPCSNSTTP